MKYNVGDIIITNPHWDIKMDIYSWWQNNKDKPMTVISSLSHRNTVKVKENRFCWSNSWVMPYKAEDMFDEKDFEL